MGLLFFNRVTYIGYIFLQQKELQKEILNMQSKVLGAEQGTECYQTVVSSETLPYVQKF